MTLFKIFIKLFLIFKGRSDLAFLRRRIRLNNQNCSAKESCAEGSQNNQDQWILKYYGNREHTKKFVEFGAHDGLTNSNTLKLEREHNWTGLLIEPIPTAFTQLQAARSSVCINACISDHEGYVEFVEVLGPSSQLSGISSTFTKRHKKRIKESISNNNGSTKKHNIRCLTLDQLLTEHNVNRIDYLSIDTEGSEYSILKVFPFKKYDIECIAIENNYHGDGILYLMDKNGYKLTEIMGADEIYVKC